MSAKKKSLPGALREIIECLRVQDTKGRWYDDLKTLTVTYQIYDGQEWIDWQSEQGLRLAERFDLTINDTASFASSVAFMDMQ